VLLTFEKRATAFAGTTVYTCISRHYPLTILLSLCLQCPRDVRLVQDETGMGLVAAQFVTGFFRKMTSGAEEWQVVTEFMIQADYVLRDGRLPKESEHPGFHDWWKKMEFLIAFGTGQKLKAEKNYPTEHLLHAALSNSDVPPLAVRLLLALYPDSIQLENPATPQNDSSLEGCLPIHLACVTTDYIPRYYEAQMMGSTLLPSPDDGIVSSHRRDMSSNNHLSTLAIVVQADPSTVYKRHNRRLPLHMAIHAGKLHSSLQPLIDAAPETLYCRDPETFLYPWLHVAAAGTDSEQVAAGVMGPDGKYNSHSRWAFSARNKYTHHVWRGLSDRQRGNAVLKQYNTLEVLDRTTTIYKLLRRAPGVMDHLHKNHKVDSFVSKKKGPIRKARDETGMGTVAQHYVNYVFLKSESGSSSSQRREPDEEHVDVYEKAIELAPRGDWSSLPPDFERWFNKMRFWIKYCCPTSSRLPGMEGNFLPTGNERYTLHMAVMNPDTPPAVIKLLLAISRPSASMRIPNTNILPLHLAVQSPPYVPRSYETRHKESVISLVAGAYAAAVGEPTDDGKAPLHLAIQAGRVNWHEDLEPLVTPDPTVLHYPDPETGLYPCQLMALQHEYTQEDRNRFLYMARNQYDNDDDWNNMTPKEQTNSVYRQYQDYQFHRLTSIFELLRQDVSVIEPPPEPEIPSPEEEEEEELVIVEENEKREEDEKPGIPNLQQSHSVDDDDESETSTEYGYLANTPMSLDIVLGGQSSPDHTDTEASKSLTEADTICSVPQSPQTSIRDSSLSARSQSQNMRSLANGSHGYIPDTLHSVMDDSSRTGGTNRTGPPDLDDYDSFGGNSSHVDSGVSNSHHTGLPDFDTSDEGSDLLELESRTTNRSGGASLESQDRRSFLGRSKSEGSVSTETSEGSRVRDAPAKSSLMRLLSQHNSNAEKPPEDVYECDASLLSNLDVMSTLSSTIHNVTGHRQSAHSGGFYGNGAPPMLTSGHSNSLSDDMSASLGTETETEGGESSGVEFAQDSLSGEMSFTFAGDESSTALSLPMPADFLNKIGNESDSEGSEEESIVFFQFRRKPRTEYWEDNELVNAPVRLASTRRGNGEERSNMDMSEASPLMQMVNASTSHRSSTSAIPKSSRRTSSVSLKSHLSDLTQNFSDTKHTFKSFATDGSARSNDKSFATSGEKSFGTADEKSFATADEKSFATAGDSYAGDRSYASLSPGGFKRKAGMKWVTDQFESPSKPSKELESDDQGPTPRTGHKSINRDDGVDSSTNNSGRSLHAPSLADDDEASKQFSDSTPNNSIPSESFSLKSPFDFVEGASRSVGMVWLDDESESGSLREKAEQLSPKVKSLLMASHTSFDESKDDLLFNELSDASSTEGAHTSSSNASSKKRHALQKPNESVLAMGQESDDDSESSSSVMQFNIPGANQKKADTTNDSVVEVSEYEKFTETDGSRSEIGVVDSKAIEEVSGDSENDFDDYDRSKQTEAGVESESQVSENEKSVDDAKANKENGPPPKQMDENISKVTSTGSGSSAEDEAGHRLALGIDDSEGGEQLESSRAHSQPTDAGDHGQGILEHVLNDDSRLSKNISATGLDEEAEILEAEEKDVSAIDKEIRRLVDAASGLVDDDNSTIRPGSEHSGASEASEEPPDPKALDEDLILNSLLEDESSRSSTKNEQAFMLLAADGALEKSVNTAEDEKLSSPNKRTEAVREASMDCMEPETYANGSTTEKSKEVDAVPSTAANGAHPTSPARHSVGDSYSGTSSASSPGRPPLSPKKPSSGGDDEKQGSPLGAHLDSDTTRDSDQNALSSTIVKYMPESTMAAPRLDPIEEEMSMASSHVSLSASSLHSKGDNSANSALDRSTTAKQPNKSERRLSNESFNSESSSTASSKRRVFDKNTFTWKEVSEDEFSALSAEAATAAAQSGAPKKRKKKKKASVMLNLSSKSGALRKSGNIRQPLGSIPERRSSKDKTTMAPASDFVCLICEESQRQVVMQPCMHLAICSDCSGKYKEIYACPLCHQQVSGRLNIQTS